MGTLNNQLNSGGDRNRGNGGNASPDCVTVHQSATQFLVLQLSTEACALRRF